MDAAEETQRWRVALENRRAAEQALHQGFLGTSVSRGYYACFQAMWVAVGDPSLRLWKHSGLMQVFCRGRWASPVILPSSLALLYKRLLALYDLRLDADYRALAIESAKAREGLDTVGDVLQLIAGHKALPEGNSI